MGVVSPQTPHCLYAPNLLIDTAKTIRISFVRVLYRHVQMYIINKPPQPDNIIAVVRDICGRKVFNDFKRVYSYADTCAYIDIHPN